MGPIALFGIENSGLALAVNLLLLFLVVIWLALVYWTWSDAHRRLADPMLVACATAASLFPFVGTIVSMIVRPPEFLDDVRLRELEMHAAESRLHTLDWQLCPYCDHDIRSDYLRCPNCQRRLKEPCRNCARPLEPTWTICPYCEYEVIPSASTAPPEPTTRRRRRQQQETAAIDYPPQ